MKWIQRQLIMIRRSKMDKRKFGYWYWVIYIWIMQTLIYWRNGIFRRIRIKSIIMYLFQVIWIIWIKLKRILIAQRTICKLKKELEIYLLIKLNSMVNNWYMYLEIMIQTELLGNPEKEDLYWVQDKMPMYINVRFS